MSSAPRMNDIVMYTNKAIDNYPGYGRPVYQPLQNIQPVTSKVGLDPFPCNVPKEVQDYEKHFSLGTQYWGAVDSEWELKEAKLYREYSHDQPAQNPNTTQYLNDKGFSHTGFLGAEYNVLPTDPRFNRNVYGSVRYL